MTEYATIFNEHLKKYTELQSQQRRIQSEVGKVAEMLKASFGMMTEEEQTNFAEILAAVLEQAVKQELGLTEAIRNLLESNRKEWFNAIRIRERLMASGFDFSGYTSNPLASVHTVLKRFKRTEVKARQSVAGIKEYRWVKPAPLGIPPDLESPKLYETPRRRNLLRPLRPWKQKALPVATNYRQGRNPRDCSQ